MQTLTWFLLRYAAPGREPETIAVLLFDPDRDVLWCRFLDNFNHLSNEDLDYLEALGDDVSSKVLDGGATKLLENFQATLSNVLLISDGETVEAQDPELELDRLFSLHVRTLSCNEHLL